MQQGIVAMCQCLGLRCAELPVRSRHCLSCHSGRLQYAGAVHCWAQVVPVQLRSLWCRQCSESLPQHCRLPVVRKLKGRRGISHLCRPLSSSEQTRKRSSLDSRSRDLVRNAKAQQWLGICKLARLASHLTCLGPLCTGSFVRSKFSAATVQSSE